ncbi:protocatechuate 3,4-dioxygenase beta subunit [Kibdelosporangium banguiense]|uniref:Protocatechuate 3,4-dioxygenase beta subunit n=1 Tax=Kibdelosporangium banguiense TaxID=1365924 RepID=A0ABS4T916_9PSEU|nr:carboxypeptidase-like regulatory domain-containing protein [Kibdelosporangium banguiense]MBP2320811.1 protocatechuate 3,4-dioxygenase beta subunit [Kibdelosporangium banguiense]
MRIRLTALAAAIMLLVATGGTASAEVVLAYGTVADRFTGKPVAGACVSVYDAGQVEVGRDCADEAGRYEVSGPDSGYYKIKATAPGYADTWNADLLGDARDFDGAQSRYLSREFLNLGLRPPGEGALSGRVTAGHTVRGQIQVRPYDVDYPQQRLQWVTVADDGTYRIAGLWSAHYKLEISTSYDGDQWYRQKETLSEADVITVPAGPDVVVDEQIIPPGTIDLTVVDEVSGAPVKEFCVFAPGVGAERPCTTTGQISYQLPRGTYYLAITTQKTHFSSSVAGVVVRPGEVTKVVEKAKPAIAIQTTVRDAATGRAVADTCVEPIEVAGHGVPGSEFGRNEWCSDQNGQITIGPLTPAAYQLLVRPKDKKYGMQWVGRLSGGTGDQRYARKIDGPGGVLTRLPPIRLDPAGTVSGTVTDKQTGRPIANIGVLPYATTTSYARDAVRTDEQGNYRLTGLGPYFWPLEYVNIQGTYAWQWSGGAADRFDAKMLKVDAGRDTKADESLSPGGAFAGRTSIAGQPYGWVEVKPVNARTGDVAGQVETDFSQGYVIDGLATQDLKIHFREVSSARYRTIWYKDATSYATATPVWITAGQTVGGIDQRIQ